MSGQSCEFTVLGDGKTVKYTSFRKYRWYMPIISRSGVTIFSMSDMQFQPIDLSFGSFAYKVEGAIRI